MKKIISSILTLAIVMTSCGGNANKGAREPQELSGAGVQNKSPLEVCTLKRNEKSLIQSLFVEQHP